MGKSRLVRVLRERLVDTPHSWLECRCSPHAQNTAFGPIIELMTQGLDFTEADPPEERLASLERGMALVEMEDDTPVIGSLLGLPVSDAEPPEQLHQRVVAACARWTMALGRQQPLVVAVEDLHWADPSSLEVLAALVAGVPDLPVLVAATHRPEFEPPWPTRDHLVRLTLGRLRSRQATEMVAVFSGGDELSEELTARVVERAGGIPLFVEELTKAVAEAGGATESEIPPTLQDSLMARLDRLPRGKEVAQVGSVIGREFDQPLLEDVAPIDTAGAQSRAGRARRRRASLPPRGTARRSDVFKHALVQDTAYGSLLRRTRPASSTPGSRSRLELRESGDEVLAHHLEESGQAGPAAERWARAARWALGHGAAREGQSATPATDSGLWTASPTGRLATRWSSSCSTTRSARPSRNRPRHRQPRRRRGRAALRGARRSDRHVPSASWSTCLARDQAVQPGRPSRGRPGRRGAPQPGRGRPGDAHLGHLVLCVSFLFRADYERGGMHAEKAADVGVDPDDVRAEVGTDFGVWLPWWLSIAETYAGRLDAAVEMAEPAMARASDALLTFDRVQRVAGAHPGSRSPGGLRHRTAAGEEGGRGRGGRRCSYRRRVRGRVPRLGARHDRRPRGSEGGAGGTRGTSASTARRLVWARRSSPRSWDKRRWPPATSMGPGPWLTSASRWRSSPAKG